MDDHDTHTAPAPQSLGWRWAVSTNQHRQTNGPEWGWIGEGADGREPAGIRVHWNGEEGYKKARLIAAAPELLEALQEAVEDLLTSLRFPEGWECSEDELVGKARAAIARATGATQ